MFMVLSTWQSHCESSPGSFNECRIRQAATDRQTKPTDCLALSLITTVPIYTAWWTGAHVCEQLAQSCYNLRPLGCKSDALTTTPSQEQ